MLGIALGGGGQPQQFVLGRTGGRRDGRDPRLAARDGAGLIEHHGIDAVRHFERFAAFDQDAALGAAARSHHDGHGRGQPQRAGQAMISTATAFTMAVGERREEQPRREGDQPPPPALPAVK